MGKLLVGGNAQPAARQHPRQGGIALEQVVVEGRTGVHHRERDQQPEQDFVRIARERVQGLVLARDRRQLPLLPPTRSNFVFLSFGPATA
jgi:hypothetical protein